MAGEGRSERSLSQECEINADIKYDERASKATAIGFHVLCQKGPKDAE